jgi:anti-sigma regulatory factor (Ser/Thr protein kinase)
MATEGYLHRAKLRVESKLEALADVLDWFDSLKIDAINNRTWLEFKTIVAEAFDNTVCHAHQGLSSQIAIDLEITISRRAIALIIWDYGAKFDLEAHKNQLPKRVNPEAESGRGILLLKELSDYFSYTRLPDRRNCLLVVKIYSPVATKR